MIYLGVDPGNRTGALGVLRGDSPTIELYDMPPNYRALNRCFRSLAAEDQVLAAVEKVNSYAGEGHQGAFSFGFNFGSILTSLDAAGIVFREVSPKTWQAAFGNPGKNLETKLKKRAHRDVAQKHFPGPVIAIQRADAALLALYSRQVGAAWLIRKKRF